MHAVGIFGLSNMSTLGIRNCICSRFATTAAHRVGDPITNGRRVEICLITNMKFVGISAESIAKHFRNERREKECGRREREARQEREMGG